MTASLDDVLAGASRPERAVAVCLAGRLVAEHQQACAELDRARHTDTTALAGRLASSPQAPQVATRVQQLEEGMRAATHTFRFRALSARAWSDLLAAHPDPGGQKAFGETFVAAAIGACCVEPAGLDDPARLAQLLELLSAGQVDELFAAAWDVNQTAPKELISYTASAVLRDCATS